MFIEINRSEEMKPIKLQKPYYVNHGAKHYLDFRKLS